MTASDFDHAHGFLLTRGRSPYIRRLSLLRGRHEPGRHDILGRDRLGRCESKSHVIRNPLPVLSRSCGSSTTRGPLPDIRPARRGKPVKKTAVQMSRASRSGRQAAASDEESAQCCRRGTLLAPTASRSHPASGNTMARELPHRSRAVQGLNQRRPDRAARSHGLHIRQRSALQVSASGTAAAIIGSARLIQCSTALLKTASNSARERQRFSVDHVRVQPRALSRPQSAGALESTATTSHRRSTRFLVALRLRMAGRECARRAGAPTTRGQAIPDRTRSGHCGRRRQGPTFALRTYSDDNRYSREVDECRPMAGPREIRGIGQQQAQNGIKSRVSGQSSPDEARRDRAKCLGESVSSGEPPFRELEPHWRVAQKAGRTSAIGVRS